MILLPQISLTKRKFLAESQFIQEIVERHAGEVSMETGVHSEYQRAAWSAAGSLECTVARLNLRAVIGMGRGVGLLFARTLNRLHCLVESRVQQYWRLELAPCRQTEHQRVRGAMINKRQTPNHKGGEVGIRVNVSST